MRNRILPGGLEIGVVRIIGGAYAGKLGYFNDITCGESRFRRTKALVYLGMPFASEPVILSLRFLRTATREQNISYEMDHLGAMPTDFRQEFGV